MIVPKISYGQRIDWKFDTRYTLKKGHTRNCTLVFFFMTVSKNNSETYKKTFM